MLDLLIYGRGNLNVINFANDCFSVPGRGLTLSNVFLELISQLRILDKNGYQFIPKLSSLEAPFCIRLRGINSRSPNHRITSLQSKGNPVFKRINS